MRIPLHAYATPKTCAIPAVAIAFAVSMAVGTTCYAMDPDDAPALAAPDGEVVTVTNVGELYDAVSQLTSGTTIVLARGEYRLHKPIRIHGSPRREITIRGETDRYQDVVICGAGMNNKAVYHGIMAENVDGLTVANVTIGWVGYHPITLSPNCRAPRVYHCRLVDAGEQFIKANSDGSGGGVDDGVVEYSIMEYTDFGPPNGYTNGVDVHGGDRWIIRHNLFRNIRTPRGARYKTVPAVLMWNGASNTLCEANTFVNCDRAIAFGLVQREGYADHTGGVIRNNFIVVGRRQVPNVDAGIYVASPRTQVLHNTILLGGGYPNAIEARWKVAEGVVAANNLVEGRITARDGADVTSSGNATWKPSVAFRDAPAGDLHLTAGIPQVSSHADCPEDWDGSSRPAKIVTPGADERDVPAQRRH